LLLVLQICNTIGHPVLEEIKASIMAGQTPNACGTGAINLSYLTKPAGGSNVDYKCVQPNCPDKSYDYYMNVCAPSTSGTDCSPKGFGDCQYITGSMTFVASLGTWNSAQWTAPDATSVQASLTDGDRCYMQGEWITRTTRVLFQCTSKTEQEFTVTEELNNCVFNLVLPVSCSACDPACVHGTCNEQSQCVCDSGWRGSDCSIPVCAPTCEHGVCDVTHKCVCDEGWYGPMCAYNPDDKGMSGGAVAGVAIGCVIAGLVVGGASVFGYLRYKGGTRGAASGYNTMETRA